MILTQFASPYQIAQKSAVRSKIMLKYISLQNLKKGHPELNHVFYRNPQSLCVHAVMSHDFPSHLTHLKPSDGEMYHPVK